MPQTLAGLRFTDLARQTKRAFPVLNAELGAGRDLLAAPRALTRTLGLTCRLDSAYLAACHQKL